MNKSLWLRSNFTISISPRKKFFFIKHPYPSRDWTWDCCVVGRDFVFALQQCTSLIYVYVLNQMKEMANSQEFEWILFKVAQKIFQDRCSRIQFQGGYIFWTLYYLHHLLFSTTCAQVSHGIINDLPPSHTNLSWLQYF